MKTNKLGISIIKRFEGLHDGDLSIIGLQPKLDPVGIWTEGWGRAMRYNGKFLKGLNNKDIAYRNITIHTKEEADIALLQDLIVFEDIVMSKINKPINCNKFSAVVSHTYNTGGSSTLFKLVNSGTDSQIREWFENHYIKSGGVYLRGLKLRRKAEADLYFTPCN